MNRLRWQNIKAIAKKDLLEVRQNRAAWMPMVLVPMIFVLIFPLGVLLTPQLFPSSIDSLVSDPDIHMMLDRMPPNLQSEIAQLSDLQKVFVAVLGYMFAPLFLIFPLAFSTVVAAESFAGERERKTMEALLYTPATERELFLGKVLSALIPSLGISWLSFIGYSIVLNAGGFSIFERIWFPVPAWWPLIFWITPALALLGISFTVLISARVQTFMGAYQLSASLVTIVVALLVGQISGVVYLTAGVGMVVGIVFWVIAAMMMFIAMRGFNRAKLLLGIKINN